MVCARSLVSAVLLLASSAAIAQLPIGTQVLGGDPLPKSVLVVGNANSQDSIDLVNYYMAARGIPTANELLLNWSADQNADTISLANYQSQIATPVYNAIAALGGIDYILLCRNLPIKISDTGGSVDSALAAMTTQKSLNPYHMKLQPFNAATYGMYLVTRLDGWSWSDARSLIDNATASNPGTGVFALDEDPTKNGTTAYAAFNSQLGQAASYLESQGLSVMLDTTTSFVLPSGPLSGYVSWGSNDASFSGSTFASLTFLPGAVAETAVSTSASNLRYPGGTQSQIATLIHNGVTGVKGYVSEPYIDAVANPLWLDGTYALGYNLAESFYAASEYVGWKDVVVGDPLAAPYRITIQNATPEPGSLTFLACAVAAVVGIVALRRVARRRAPAL